jgi:ribonuclease III
VLVTRETCAEVGRTIGLPPLIRLGKQAREDHALLSDNVVGDVVEALIGALFLDAGLDCAKAFIRKHWAPFLDDQKRAPMHPKSGLQEVAAARNLGIPLYELISRFGPHHQPRFRVKVSLGPHGEAEAEGANKQEAEKEAAAALLEILGKGRSS